MRAVWRRVESTALGAGQILPIPVQPPALRVIRVVSFRRARRVATPGGPRSYTLQAHAQARWRVCPGGRSASEPGSTVPRPAA